MKEAADAAREALIEMVAEADESLMEKFFDAGTLTQEELVAGLPESRRGRQGLSPRLHVGDDTTSAFSRCSTRSSGT